MYMHIAVNVIKLSLIKCFLADIISTVEFNHDGEYLATGDKGGRVVIFQRGGLPVVSTVSHDFPLSRLNEICRSHPLVYLQCSDATTMSTAPFSHTSQSLTT